MNSTEEAKGNENNSREETKDDKANSIKEAKGYKNNSREETKDDKINSIEEEKDNKKHSIEEAKGNKIYCDYKKFKGNTFETNINSINNLLLGKAQKISNTQFIYVDENDGKNYISANFFIIRRKAKDEKEDNKENEIKKCYPHNFIYSIYSYDDKIFYINKNNDLLIFKIDGNTNVTKYVFAQKEEKKDPKNNKNSTNAKKDGEKHVINEIKEEEVNTVEDTNGKAKANSKNRSEDIYDIKKGKDKEQLNNRNENKNKKKEKDKNISNNTNDKKNEKKKENEFQYENQSQSSINIQNKEEFKKKIEKLGKIEDSNLNKKYELLIDILNKDLEEDLQLNSPKNINKIIKIDFDDIESCEVKYSKLELDCTGIIQEQLDLKKGEITFKNGINDLITFIKNKKDKNVIDSTKIDHTFKTPIIFKNFEDTFIPPKEAIICEIKSGFDIKTLKSQIKERINFVNDCFFVNNKPSYFIGIVNLNEEFVDRLYYIKDVLDADFIFKEKIIILSTINYLYCDIDASLEVHTDYLLYKKLNNMDKGIKGKFYGVFILFFIIFILLFFFKNDINTMKNDINTMKNGINTMKNDINTMKNDINTMKNDINNINNKMEQRFNEFYQILIDATKNGNMLLNTKKSFNSKDNNIQEDMCYPKEL